LEEDLTKFPVENKLASDENSTCRLTNGQNEAFMNINDTTSTN